MLIHRSITLPFPLLNFLSLLFCFTKSRNCFHALCLWSPSLVFTSWLCGMNKLQSVHSFFCATAISKTKAQDYICLEYYLVILQHPDCFIFCLGPFLSLFSITVCPQMWLFNYSVLKKNVFKRIYYYFDNKGVCS